MIVHIELVHHYMETTDFTGQEPHGSDTGLRWSSWYDHLSTHMRQRCDTCMIHGHIYDFATQKGLDGFTLTEAWQTLDVHLQEQLGDITGPVLSFHLRA